MNKKSINNLIIIKEKKVKTSDVAILRQSVGWLPLAERLGTALNNSYSCYVVKDNKILIGFARVNSDKSIHAHIVDVMIHPNYQRSGLGKKLMKRVISDLKKEGFIYISLTYSESLIPFYKAVGFDIRRGGLITNID